MSSKRCRRILFSAETFFQTTSVFVFRCVCPRRRRRHRRYLHTGLELRHNNVFITQLINGDSSCKHMPIYSAVKNQPWVQKWIELRRGTFSVTPGGQILWWKGVSLWNIEVGACKQNQALLLLLLSKLQHSGKHTTATSFCCTWSGRHYFSMKQSA